nr:uncharacterized protein LOC112769805 [Arachis hypogaea]
MSGESGGERGGGDGGRVLEENFLVDGKDSGNLDPGLIDEASKGKNVMEASEKSGLDQNKVSGGAMEIERQGATQDMEDGKKKVKDKEPFKVSFRDKVVGEASASFSHGVDALDKDKMATIIDGEIPSVVFSEEARMILSAPYKDAIIIKVLGKTFSYSAITHKLRGVWRTRGRYEVLDVGFGYFLIKFDLREDRERVLLGGPWMIAGNYVAVKPWCSSFRPCDDTFGSTLVWIKVTGLNIWYYSEKAILNIARTLGKPIKVDLATKSAKRGKYARACIQIDLGQPVKRKIMVDGFEYNIEYENLHLICDKCNCFGHVTRDYGETEKQVVRAPLESLNVSQEEDRGAEVGEKPVNTAERPPEKAKIQERPPENAKIQEFKFQNSETEDSLNMASENFVGGTLHASLEGNHAFNDGGWTKVTKRPSLGKDEAKKNSPKPKEVITWTTSSSSGATGVKKGGTVSHASTPLIKINYKRRRLPSLQNSPNEPVGGVKHGDDQMEGGDILEGERDGKNWVCSAVYGSPQSAIREDLWEHLLALGTSIQDPWLITGDFNEILHSQEVKGGHFNVNRSNYFSHILDSCNLFDLTTVGRSFTWFRKVQGNKEVAKKLDRACSNSSWRVMFPEAFTEVLSRLHSDHCPLLTRCLGLPVRKGSRPFRFQAVWVTHPSYKSVVYKAWNGNNTHIHGKLRKVQEASLKFNSRVFGNIFIKKRSLKSKLNDLQKRLEFCDDVVVKEEEQRCRDDFNSVLLQEEILWFQKSREQWVRYGDKNTKFFHMQTIIRRKANKIHGLFVSDGSWSSDPNLLQQEALSFYKDLFCSTDPVEVNCMGDFPRPSLSSEACESLIKPVSMLEVKSAVDSMSPFKAPGPDGFQAFFFKEYWDVDSPSRMKDFRPISLCNVVYKIVTKVLGGFIPGRGAPDNIIVAQEVLHFLKRTKSKKGAIAFKIDLEKASSLSILWNGNRLESFQPNRGLRQGDSISPYLFVLCMEMLACFISNQVELGAWDPVAVSRGGMKVNIDKSKAVCSKSVSNTRRNVLAGVSSIRFANELGKYLGVNINHPRASRTACLEAVEKIKSRLSSWKGRLLNRAGRLCLIKYVATSLPIYQMQVSLFPKKACSKIDFVLRNFLWKGKTDERGLNLLNWSTVITPKRYGGLGVRDTQCVNTALLGKLVWQLFHGKNKLWVRIMLAKYVQGSLGLDLQCPTQSSSIWRNITKTASRLKHGYVWCIGSLTQSFWYHPWRPSGPLAPEIPFVHISDTGLSLGDVWSGRVWNLDHLYTVLPETLKLDITTYNPIVQAGCDPNWCWGSNASKTYSTRDGYEWLLERKVAWDTNENWLWLWHLGIPKKVKGLIWLILHGAIPTASLRYRRRLTATDLCPRCNEAPESVEHCLRLCNKVSPIWESLKVGMQTWDVALDFQSWLRIKLRTNEGIFAVGLWWIWRDRNNDIFNQNDIWSKEKVLQLIRHSAAEYAAIKRSNQDPYQMRREYTDLLLKISEILQRNWVVQVQLIQRTANSVADRLAKTAARHSRPYTEFLIPCSVIDQIIRKEMISPS